MRVSLTEATLLLQQGEVVAIPTETVYGLAADARNAAAIHAIYATKQRPASNPLIVHLADIGQVTDWALAFPAIAQRLAQHFWPGPLTLVLPAQPHVLSEIRAGQATVALRIPAHPLARALIAQSGLALAAPSANKYTQLSPTTAAHVEVGLGMHIPVVDGGACEVGIESTIVSVSGHDWQLLRHGMLSEAELTAFIGKPALPLDIFSPKAPGQHRLHYAPRTLCQLFTTRSALLAHAARTVGCTALLFDQCASDSPPAPLPANSVCLPLVPAEAANQLYAALHQLDQQQATQLLIECPPNTAEWQAIRDRLQRAACVGEPPQAL